MKPFTIAFPLYSSLDEAPRILMEKMHLDLSKKQVIIPGSPMFYSPILQGPAAALEALFAEHAPLSEEESKAISAHRSLLFLQFVAKSPEEFLSFLPVAKKLLENLASGIYVENSGCAWSAKVFLELVSGDVLRGEGKCCGWRSGSFDFGCGFRSFGCAGFFVGFQMER